jgi:hypothetical protein
VDGALATSTHHVINTWIKFANIIHIQVYVTDSKHNLYVFKYVNYICKFNRPVLRSPTIPCAEGRCPEGDGKV